MIVWYSSRKDNNTKNRYVSVHFPHEPPPPILGALGLDVPAIMAADPYRKPSQQQPPQQSSADDSGDGGGESEAGVDGKEDSGVEEEAVVSGLAVKGQQEESSRVALQQKQERPVAVVALVYVSLVFLLWLWLPRWMS